MTLREDVAKTLRGPSAEGALPWELVSDVYLNSADRLIAKYEITARHPEESTHG